MGTVGLTCLAAFIILWTRPKTSISQPDVNALLAEIKVDSPWVNVSNVSGGAGSNVNLP